MATKQVLNPKYQMSWASFFGTVKEKLTKVTEKVEEKVEEPKEAEPVEEPVEICKGCGRPVTDCACEPAEPGEAGEAEEEVFFSDGEAGEELPVADTEEIADEVEDASEDEVESPDLVDTFREAQEFMKKAFGLSHKDVISREKLLAQMEAHGVEFPNLTL